MGFFDLGLGGLVSGALGLLGGERRNSAAADESAENRAWQERMSNTAHQREVDDLLKAGLNPILSASRGGAMTGSGGVASMENTISSAGQSFREWEDAKERRERVKASEQNRKIKKPVASAAEDADKGYGDIKNAVKGAVEAVVDKLIDVGQPERKTFEEAKDYAVGKAHAVLGGLTNSAVKAKVITAPQIANTSTIGGPNNWSDDHQKNMRDIRSIKDSETRSHAMWLYQQWRRKYNK